MFEFHLVLPRFSYIILGVSQTPNTEIIERRWFYVYQHSENQITEGIIWRQLLLFFFPILLGTFFQQLYNTIDSVIVGQFVGKEALAAVGGSSAQIVAFVVDFLPGFLPGHP
mgnify:CR=1 FL=1